MVQLNIMIEQLKYLASDLYPFELLPEKFRREWLFGKLFLSKVQPKDRAQVSQAIGKLLSISNSLNVSMTHTIARTLEGKVKLPPIIQENYLEDWVETARYLAYGDSDIDRSLSQDLYDEAKEMANRAMNQLIRSKL